MPNARPLALPLLAALALAGCVARLDGAITPSGPASASPKASASPRPAASASPVATTSPGPVGTPFPFPPLFGPHELRFDPPLIGDTGLTPTGVQARTYAITVRMAAGDGIVTGQASWCPSDYCESAQVQGNLFGQDLTMQIMGPTTGTYRYALKGKLQADGTVTGEVALPAEPKRTFTLVRLPEAPDVPVPSPTPVPRTSPAATPSATPAPTRSPLAGVHGAWTDAPPAGEGPVAIGACYASYQLYDLQDPEADGRDVVLDGRYVNGGGAPMASDDEHATGQRDPQSGLYVLTGTVRQGFDAEAKPLRYELRLDPLTWRLAGTRVVDGGPPQQVAFARMTKAAPPAEGCGPPPP